MRTNRTLYTVLGLLCLSWSTVIILFTMGFSKKQVLETTSDSEKDNRINMLSAIVRSKDEIVQLRDFKKNGNLEVIDVDSTSTYDANHKFLNKVVSEGTKKKEEIFNSDSIKMMKGLYMTSWIAGSQKGTKLLNKVKKYNLDAIVVDMKDASGYVTYDSNLYLVNQVGSKQIRVRSDKLEYILNYCKKNGIRTIALVVVAMDPILSKYKNNKFSIYDKATKKSTQWVDLFSVEVQDYNIEIAEELAKKGFDEINFDYIRFPDKKEVKDRHLVYQKKFRHENPAKLYQAIESFLGKAKSRVTADISVDVYAYTLWGSIERHLNENINNIGQVVEYMAENVDYIYPMIYPSHFSKKDRKMIDAKYKGPEEYDIVYEACRLGLKRIKGSDAKLIPWIQGFWGDEEYIFNELRAVNDSGVGGFLIWNSKSKYGNFWNALEKFKLQRP